MDTMRKELDKYGVPESGRFNLDDVDWTFDNVDTSYLTHGLHSYPARMIPQIPNALLKYYKREGVISEGDLLYDPFVGSGTSLVEAMFEGLNAKGNDINPFACMLSRTKTTPINREDFFQIKEFIFTNLEEELNDVKTLYKQEGDVEKPGDIREGWFPEPQLQQLWAIRKKLDKAAKKFSEIGTRPFRLALAETTREISYQRNGEYKRYRMAEEDREEHNPDVLPRFVSKSRENLNKVKEFSEKVSDTQSDIYYADSRTATDNGELSMGENVADIVITSPPYGDHKTTVAYGQFSQDPAIISGGYGYEEMREVDKQGLGGSGSQHNARHGLKDKSPTFKQTIEKLAQKDGRAQDAMDFVEDYYEVIKEVSKITKKGQPVVWVVANRTMSRINIPTHLITRELSEEVGYTHEITLPRDIPTKTLPWENAPENIDGVKGDLMAKENLVVMRSP